MHASRSRELTVSWTVAACSFVGCGAYGSAVGGAICLRSATSASIRGCTIAECSALPSLPSSSSISSAAATTTSGDALGGGLYVSDSRAEIESTTVSGCTATLGGGLYIYSGTVTLSNRTSLAGSATSSSSALYISSGVVTYVLPAPAGTWVAALECSVYREACVEGDDDCDDAAAACATSTNASAVVPCLIPILMLMLMLIRITAADGAR